MMAQALNAEPRAARAQTACAATEQPSPRKEGSSGEGAQVLELAAGVLAAACLGAFLALRQAPPAAAPADRPEARAMTATPWGPGPAARPESPLPFWQDPASTPDGLVPFDVASALEPSPRAACGGCAEAAAAQVGGFDPSAFGRYEVVGRMRFIGRCGEAYLFRVENGSGARLKQGVANGQGEVWQVDLPPGGATLIKSRYRMPDSPLLLGR